VSVIRYSDGGDCSLVPGDKPCIDVYTTSLDRTQSPDPHLHSRIDPDLNDESVPCAWDMDKMHYANPMVMLCLPPLRTESAALEEDMPIDRRVIEPESFDLSVTHQYRESYDENPGRLSFHLIGQVSHIQMEDTENITCSDSVSIQYILDMISQITFERARKIERDDDALFAALRKTCGTDLEAQLKLTLFIGGLYDNTDQIPDGCMEPGCACTISSRGSCGQAEHDNLPPDTPHFHFRCQDWDQWGESDRLFFHEPYMRSATVGSKVIVLNPEPTEAFLRGRKITEGIKLTKLHMAVLDYNDNLQSSYNPSPHRPIGSLSSFSEPPSVVIPKIIPCPLAKPIPPPRFVDVARISLKQSCDVRSGFRELFLEDIGTDVSTTHIHSIRELRVDSSRPVKGVFCDGENVVIAMVSPGR
jgi:hypothetical protein